MNVYEASMQRLDTIFKEFEYVYISFSGGKDSGVLLNLCLQYIDKNCPGRKLGVMHLDYEAQYQFTTEYVDRTFNSNAGKIEEYRCCVPFKVGTCTSMYQSYWRPWEKSKEDIWVRPMPKDAMTEFPFFKTSMWDYDFQEEFGKWLAKTKGDKKICCLVGIRTQESLNRWRAIYSDRNYKNYKGINWTKDMENGVINAYPIFDWDVEDIWTANGKFGWDYNRLYDLYYMAGLSLQQMRVASPFISEGQETLRLYQAIEPNTWGKLVGRVNGVNFTGIYGGTTAMGWKSLKLPKGHTWESFMYFLLDSLPEKTRQSYLAKLHTSMQFWHDKGGCLSDATIDKLKMSGIDIDVSESTNYKTAKKPVRMDYIDDIDISEFKEIPTFKRMCICIMKNDHLCKYMGFSQTKDELARRKNIIEKYNNIL
jgi:predicted phosphoadenosine phosphosulfate sulfurtransferase